MTLETIDGEPHITVAIPQVNPIQPVPSAVTVAHDIARASVRDKLKGFGLTDEEIEAMGLG